MTASEMNRNKTIRILVYSTCTILCMIAIFMFSAQNADDSAQLSDGLLARFPVWFQKMILPITSQGMEHDIRKYAHMFEYFCLGCSAILLFYEINSYRTILSVAEGEILCFLYACSDEFHQTFVPGRSGSFQDVMIDGIGFTLGICILTVLCRWIYSLKRRTKQ